MVALLQFLESNQHNRYGNNNNNDDFNPLEYQKQFYGLPYGSAGAGGVGGTDNDDAIVNGGEWWNDWVEPSVQYYGNSPYGHIEQAPRERHQSKGKNHCNIFFHFVFCLCTFFCWNKNK